MSLPEAHHHHLHAIPSEGVRNIRTAFFLNFGFALLEIAGTGKELPLDALTSTELEIKYSGYFDRERVQAERLKRLGHVILSPDLEYAHMRSLTFEARQKLDRLRPQSLAQAASIPGVSPNDVQNLLIEVERRRRVAAAEREPS